MMRMQNIRFPFFEEGNIQGRKKRKEKGKKKKRRRYIWTQFPQGKQIGLVSSVTQACLVALCCGGYKNCVPEMQAHPAPGELAVMGRLEESVSMVFKFLTRFFQSFLLFHFLVLVPQFYPRCIESRRERERVSSWSDRWKWGQKMETKSPPLSSQRKKKGNSQQLPSEGLINTVLQEINARYRALIEHHLSFMEFKCEITSYQLQKTSYYEHI